MQNLMCRSDEDFLSDLVRTRHQERGSRDIARQHRKKRPVAVLAPSVPGPDLQNCLPVPVEFDGHGTAWRLSRSENARFPPPLKGEFRVRLIAHR